MASSDAPATDTADDTLGVAYHDLEAANQKVEEATRELNRLKLLKIQHLQTDVEKLEKLDHGRTHRSAWRTMGALFGSECWMTQTREAGLDSSIIRLNEQIKQAEVDKAELEAPQAAIRRHIADMTRDKVRPLNILDLPEEMLVAICGHVENTDLPCSVNHDWGTRKDICSARQVCRRFNAAASGFLVRRICLEPNMASLARLDQISRHPAIAAGVHHVKLVLRLYNPAFANLADFVKYHVYVLDDQISLYSRKVGQRKVIQAERFSRKLCQLGEAWNRGTLPDDSDPAMERLVRAHRKYRDLVAEQQSFLSESTFAQAAGLAITRMPRARHLEIEDTDPREVPLLGPDVSCFGDLEEDMCRAMEEYMRQPIGGLRANECEQLGIDPPSYKCVVDMLHGIRRAGGWLETMTISLFTPGSYGTMVPAWDTRDELVSGLQKLRKFHCKIRGDPYEGNLRNAEEFVGLCIDTPSLESISIDATGMGEDTFDIGRVMGSVHRPLLTSLRLSSVDCGLEDLKVFLDRLTHEHVSLSLEWLNLLSGTWEELLDVLRNKEAGEKLLQGPEKGLDIEWMSAKEYGSIFGGGGDGGSAQLYISKKLSGEFAPNPIRALAER